MGPTQKYCKPCSEKRDLKRKRLWVREHRPPLEYSRINNANQLNKLRQVGLKRNSGSALGITWTSENVPDLLWMLRLVLPFSYALSKNHIWATSRRGHTYLREEHRGERDSLIWRFRAAITSAGIVVVQNKVWLDVLVQKPDHHGDAINILDGLCDAIKEAIGVDDRWFCVRRLDWQIVKTEPKLIVGIGQESDQIVRVCSYCGMIRPLDAFGNRKHGLFGKGRECLDCLKARSAVSRERKLRSGKV